MIKACAERGDTKGALDVLQMMRGSTSPPSSSSSSYACPRPSYRSYLAALTACSRALPPAAASDKSIGGEGEDGEAGGVAAQPQQPQQRGDWRASKEVLRMMWEDEAKRAADGDVAVPGKRGRAMDRGRWAVEGAGGSVAREIGWPRIVGGEGGGACTELLQSWSNCFCLRVGFLA